MSLPITQKYSTAAWRNAIFAVFALAGFGMANWLSRVPAVRDELGATPGEMGMIVFGIAIGSISGLLCSSHIIAALGTRNTIRWFLAFGVLGLPAAGIAVSFGSSIGAIIALAFFGIGFSVCDVAMNVSGAANERALGRNIMPVFHALFSGGTVVGVFIGAQAELLGIPITVHMGVIAALVFVLVIVATVYIPELPADEPEEPSEAGASSTPAWKTRLSVWGKKRTLLLGAIVLGMALAEGSANDWLPLAMVDGHGFDNALGAAILGVFLAAMTIGRLGGVFLLDRFGRVPVLLGCAAFAAVGLGLTIFATVPWLAVVGVVLWGLGASLGFPVGMSAAADDPKTATATVSAVATIGYVAFLVGPPAIGFLGDHVGLLHALIFVLILIVLAGLASPAAREPKVTATKSSALTNG
ncbi:MFS transporter [Lysinibacter cavernae]|uniref:MFS family permease n=1 Tax=Lysinibacter cavernae TaxID=1640652 RepID=A0A7X5R336_9MICO|nr:MFS transporter [Lysinibacter cavernae]NIH54721.1 MFS family permease [Lysinibacter cavernae]